MSLLTSLMTGVATGLTSSVISSITNIADILYPPTFSFTAPIDGSDEINSTFNAATDHTFVIDLVIPDPETAPPSNQTIFAYGLSNAASNKLELRRRTSTSDIQALLVAGNGTLGGFSQFFPSDMQYINKKMRIGFVLKDDGVQEIYINGRRWMTCTGKSIPLTNSLTALYFNAGYRTDTDGNYGTRLRYYNTAQSRAAMELITNVSFSELGLSYTKDTTALGIVGQGQSNMSGAESVGNKTTMPQVATGRLKLLNTNGAIEPFSESWYDPNGRNPLFKAFAQTFVGDSFEYFAGYMGRIGNDIAANKTQNVVVTCAAASGTKIAAEWAGARTDLNTGAGTTTNIGYMTFCLWEAIRQASAATGKVVLYLDQGQGDALDGMTEAAYETQLQGMINWLNYYYPALEYYIVGFNAYNAASTIVEANWNNINNARRDVANANADAVFIDVEDVVLTNPDGLHYLNAQQEVVGARCANAYTGGNAYIPESTATGQYQPTELAALNNALEATMVATFKPTNPSSGSVQFPVHINRGGSNTSFGIRIDADADFRGNYRDDAGIVSADPMVEQAIANINQTFAISVDNRLGIDRKIVLTNLDEVTFTSGTFANPDFTDLDIGSRNGGSDPFSGTVSKVVITDTFLDKMALSKLMQNDTRLALIGGGQSLIRQLWVSTDTSSDTGIVNLRSTLRTFDSDLEIIDVDAAEGGSAYDPRSIAGDANEDEIWLDEGNHIGQELKQFMDLLKVNALTDARCLWNLGVSDSFALNKVDQVTTLEIKEKIMAVFNIIRQYAPNMTFDVANMGRRTSFNNSPAYQILRDIYKDLSNQYAWINLLPEVYDLALTDAVHNSDAALPTIGQRYGRYYARELGNTVTGSVMGAEITSVLRSGTTVTVNITHDGGTDFTPTTAIQGFQFHDDDVAITISAAVRTDANTITLTLASEPTGVECLYYGFDAMTDITDTTKIVKDNSPQAMPLQTANILL